MLEMLTQEWGWVAIAVLEISCFVAYFLKGFSGFGPALIFIPTVALLFEPRLALAASAFIDLIVGIVLIFTLHYSRSDWPVIGQIVGWMAVGTVAGAMLAGTLSSGVILILIAIVVLGFGSMLIIYRMPIPEKLTITHRKRMWLGSIIGGFTTGLVGIGGPFIVMATRSQMDKNSFRRILVAVALFENIIRLGAYRAVGIWQMEALQLAALVGPAVIVGIIVGAYTHGMVDERRFNIIIGCILLVISARIFWGFV